LTLLVQSAIVHVECFWELLESSVHTSVDPQRLIDAQISQIPGVTPTHDKDLTPIHQKLAGDEQFIKFELNSSDPASASINQLIYWFTSDELNEKYCKLLLHFVSL
jgi:hypothetical protein